MEHISPTYNLSSSYFMYACVTNRKNEFICLRKGQHDMIIYKQLDHVMFAIDRPGNTCLELSNVNQSMSTIFRLIFNGIITIFHK